MATVQFSVETAVLFDKAARLRVEGELDAHTCAAMEDALSDLLEFTCFIIVDLKELRYLSSAGAGALVNSSVAAHARGGKLVLLNLAPAVRQMLSLLGLDGVLSVAESEESALQEMRT